MLSSFDVNSDPDIRDPLIRISLKRRKENTIMALYTMKELLKDAQSKKYGIGYFNAVNMEMVRAYITAAEECFSPIIIGTAEGLLPYGSFEWLIPMMIRRAEQAKVPVAIHLDHTYHFEVLMQALRIGFGSIMYDGSRLADHNENVRNSAEIVRIAHAMGAGVECELGSVGGLSDENGKADAVIYTEPKDAEDFIEATGADFLAVSIGTQHGVYKSVPKLDIPRLKEIRAAVDVPLVLHGGSGLSDDDFRSTIEGGISKINVYTDIILAAKKEIFNHPEADYTDLNKYAEQAMTEATIRKIKLFGGEGQAW